MLIVPLLAPPTIRILIPLVCQLELVLFDDALRHLLRLNRLIEMPRGSALLVGVGGSGKQSLTRLASYISRAVCFQITLTKTYGVNSFMEDLRCVKTSVAYHSKGGNGVDKRRLRELGVGLREQGFRREGGLTDRLHMTC